MFRPPVLAALQVLRVLNVHDWWLGIIGLGMIAVGMRWCVTRKIKRSAYPFSSDISFITGKPAFLCGVLTIISGFFVIFVGTEFIQVDRCIDLGGSYDYENKECDLP